MSGRNVAQAAYALSRLVHFAGIHSTRARAVAVTALTTERTSNVDVSRGSRSLWGCLVGFATSRLCLRLCCRLATLACITHRIAFLRTVTPWHAPHESSTRRSRSLTDR